VFILPAYIIGITGASGSIYALRLLEELSSRKCMAHIVATHNGKKVFEYETGCKVDNLSNLNKEFIVHDIDNFFSPIASGSFKIDGMIIVPCTMATLGEIATGTSKNLLGRAADVCLKEGRKLIIVPREAPLNLIHIENMLRLVRAGAVIFPAMPSFYGKPNNINDIVNTVVGRLLDALGVQNDLYSKWGF